MRHSAEVKAEVLGKIRADRKVRDVSREYGISEPTVRSWIPPEATYEKLHSGRYFDILVLKPEFILLSKAVKAPEKNGPLIVEALEKLGSEFENSLIKHGADMEYFRKIKKKRDERER